MLAVAGCEKGDPETGPGPTSTSTPTTLVERPRGGSVRVGVWAMPDPAAPTLAGAAVRSLVLPQLFTLSPNGDRVPSLVAPGSDVEAPDFSSVSFLLRPGARWSNGAPITADDLRRSADAAWVAGVDGPAPDGRITVRFTKATPRWRQLWSDTASVAPPAPGVWGGPFVVAGMTPGLETVLRRNDQWWGGPGPWLDEVRLVLVPEAVMARQLFERGDLDVLATPAYTNRRGQLGAGALAGEAGGWDVRLVMNPKRLNDKQRSGLVAAADARLFTETLLKDEARVGVGVVQAVGADVGALKGKTVVLSAEVEEPMAFSFGRALQKRVKAAGGVVELRNAEAERVEGWVASGDYDAAVLMAWTAPDGCLACPEGPVAASLWSPLPVVAVRPGVEGVDVNPWALTPAWDADGWWRQPGDRP